ncbi:MAG: polysaccharide biosynthesis protein [Rhodobacterales bacterium]|nr:MAG: polysaccharide biosynthesis protein [Rhodobacterales bacterium]
MQLLKIAVFFLCVLPISACSVPRGAALTSEILSEEQSDKPTFAVVPVTREKLVQIARWPRTGPKARYHWLQNSRGPDSPVIRTGDVVNLVIWDNQENSLLTPQTGKLVDMPGLVVSPAGTIFIPYLDEVQVRGKTPSQARLVLQEALTKIVPSAQVQLSFQAGKMNSADLITGVARPGSYPLPDRNYSILSLIAQGGGISPTLRNPLVRLIRGNKTYETPASVLFSKAAANITIRGNDKVLVEEDKRYFTALGASGTEKIVYFDKENITTLEALSMVGGLAESRANLQGILLLREYPAKAVRKDGKGPEMRQVIFTFDLTSADGLFAARKFKVNPQDTILATESAVTATRTVLSLVGSVFGVVNAVDR